eukprot:SAG22_NODE_1810_length_3525_cov_13.151781_5_plen_85_part_00
MLAGFRQFKPQMQALLRYWGQPLRKDPARTLPFCCASTVFLAKTVPFLGVCLSVLRYWEQPPSKDPATGLYVWHDQLQVSDFTE